jgi:hypothetical protein
MEIGEHWGGKWHSADDLEREEKAKAIVAAREAKEAQEEAECVRKYGPCPVIKDTFMTQSAVAGGWSAMQQNPVNNWVSGGIGNGIWWRMVSWRWKSFELVVKSVMKLVKQGVVGR